MPVLSAQSVLPRCFGQDYLGPVYSQLIFMFLVKEVSFYVTSQQQSFTHRRRG